MLLARAFITRAYPTLKKNNPNIPILIREAQGTVPKVYARYGRFAELTHEKQAVLTRTAAEFGQEKSQSLEGLSDKQITDTVTGLVMENQ